MRLELTEQEANVVNFYLKRGIIDAEGIAAIGVGSCSEAKSLKSVLEKLAFARRDKDAGLLDLGSVLKLLSLNENDHKLYLQEGKKASAKAYTVKETKDKFDLEKTRIIRVSSYFDFGEYDGFLIVIEHSERTRKEKNS